MMDVFTELLIKSNTILKEVSSAMTTSGCAYDANITREYSILWRKPLVLIVVKACHFQEA